MIRSDILRGYNDLFILSILNEHDSYGYEISKIIVERSLSSYLMKETTLYSIFIRLEKNGYIVSYKGDESKGRPRTYYHILQKGQDYLFMLTNEWVQTKTLINYFIKGA